MNRTLLIGIGLGGLAALLDIIGTTIPYWLVVPLGRKVGLFLVCGYSEMTYTCSLRDPALFPTWWQATQSLVLLSILAFLVGIILAILFGCKMKDALAIWAAGLTFAGAALALIGVIIFGFQAIQNDLQLYFHAGFALVILAALIAIPAAVMIFLSKDRKV